MKSTLLKNSLRQGKLSIGSWITLAHPSIPEIMAQAEPDFLVIDLEHSTISLKDCQILLQASQGQGITTLVRVSENNENLIKRVMDAGAQGIIVPMVKTAGDAQRAVKSVRYAPSGERGVGLARAQGHGFSFDAYRKWLEKDSIILALIEHKDAVKNLESILKVKGIDGTLIGPYDLSGSLGHPGEFDRKEVKDAITRYETVCQKLKKPMGFHLVHPEMSKASEIIAKGYSFLAVGFDALFLGNKCRESISEIRNEQKKSRRGHSRKNGLVKISR